MDVGRMAVKMRQMFPAMSKNKAVKVSKNLKKSLKNPWSLFATSNTHRMKVLNKELKGRDPWTRFVQGGTPK